MASIPEEIIVHECDNALFKEKMGSYKRANLKLTDLNIFIYITSEWTGEIKETKVIPLNTINIINGEAQVFTRSELLGLDHYLEINTSIGSYEFKLSQHDVEIWAEHLSVRVLELSNTVNADSSANDDDYDYSIDIEPANEAETVTSEERVIYECDDASTRDEKGYLIRVKLKLTDQNLYIYIPSYWTGKIKETKVIPLNSINIIKGKIQVFTRAELMGVDNFLKINSSYDSYEFGMSQRDVERWAEYLLMRVPELCKNGKSALQNRNKSQVGMNSRNLDTDTDASDLDVKENVIYKCENAMIRSEKLFEKGVDLKLTDQNLYMYIPSFWTSKPKEIKVVPLNTIKVNNGVVQVFTREEGSIFTDYNLEIHAAINSYTITMKKADVESWADYITDRRLKFYYDEKRAHKKRIDVKKTRCAPDLDNDIDAAVDSAESKNFDDIGIQKDEESHKRPGFVSDAFTNTRKKEYKTDGYVIKFEKNSNHNSWNVYNNNGVCIYKVKRALVAMRPCLKIYDNRQKQYVAEIKKHIDPMPHVHDSFVWVEHGQTLGIVTLRLSRKPFKCTYTAGFIGWTYGVGLTKHYEIQGGERIIAKPISTTGADPEPFEYYDLNNELKIVMMYYTHYLDTHEQRTALIDRFLGG